MTGTIVVLGATGYTGELLALAADLLATGQARESGVTGPLEAFGLELLQTSSAALGLVPTSH